MRSLEEMPEVWGSTGRSKEKLKFGAEKSDVPSKNRPKTDPKRGKTRKKWASQGKKRERALEKSPENGLKTGKSGKNGDWGAKKVGVGERRTNGLCCRFCNAMKWQNGRK